MPTWNLARVTRGGKRSGGAQSIARLSALEKFLFMDPLRDVYQKARQSEGILENLLRDMRIDVRVTQQDLARIPHVGPAIVVANHPFGILDGATLGALLLRIRRDVKILTNYLIGAIAELTPHCIYLDPFEKRSSVRTNALGLRRAIAHLRRGGMLVIFPAGEVSHWQFH